MDIAKKDYLLNVDYTQIGGTVGVIGGILFSVRGGNVTFGKTAIFALLFGAAGAFIGSNYEKHFARHEK